MYIPTQEYYRELGVAPHASIEEIKAAFRRKAMRWHPDRNKAMNAEEVFKRIKSAYEVLSDEARRKAYDEEIRYNAYGPASSSYKSNPKPSYYNEDPTTTQATTTAPEARPSYREPLRKKGRELRRIIAIPLEIALHGGQHLVSMYMGHVCPTCVGEGDLPSSTCNTCHGSGHVYETIGHNQPCPDCRGTGRTPELCTDCLGTGLVQRMRTLKLTVPAGVTQGTVIRLRNAGTESRSGGPRGDILFTIRLAPHKYFRVRDLDLLACLKVDFSKALLGCKLRVNTLHGKINVHLPSLLRGPRVLRLKGLGLKNSRAGTQGDLLVRVMDGRPVVAGYLIHRQVSGRYPYYEQ